jgi:hypothetical protein
MDLIFVSSKDWWFFVDIVEMVEGSEMLQNHNTEFNSI